MPSTLVLFDVVVNELKGKKYIQFIVAKVNIKTILDWINKETTLLKIKKVKIRGYQQ